MARRIGAAVLVLVLVGLSAGCSQRSTPDDGAAPAAAAARPILVTRDWGVVDGMLSVVVRNTSDRTLRSATAVITARDRNDVLVSSSLEDPNGCCAVTELPPGQEFGFYVDVGDTAADISRVDVAYRDVRWATAANSSPSPLEAKPVRLDGNGQGAIAIAEVTSSVRMVPQASVQAFLTDADGQFLAVVAGRWFCFSKGRHEIRMQLQHPVPAGTTVDKVLVHPVTDDPDGTALNCAGR
ncbi:hypothetical protein [Nocardioides conyzicola]|uniref:Lipoprotein n=1 Tax=Nocardioides conyzicola TaxID=1651781 RepID=A0ABP8WRT0_9ACTN